MRNFSLKGHAAMFAANAMWGLMAPVAKSVMVDGIVSPLVLTNLRVGGAMVLFWVASLFVRRERVPLRHLGLLFVASLLAIVFNQGCYISGVGLTSPADASIITTSMPLVAMVLAAIFLKEPVTWKKILGIALGAGGAILLITGGGQAAAQAAQAGEPGRHLLGDLLVFAAQCSYALYFVLFKNFVGRYSMVTIMKWMFTFAWMCLLPVSYPSLTATRWEALRGAEIASAAYVVVCATFMCYMLIVVGQKLLRPTVAGMYNYVQPVVACVVTVYMGLDSFTANKAMAIVLIFCGVYMVTASRSRADELRARRKESRPNG